MWADETLYENWRQSFRVKQVLAREQSPFQYIHVFDTWSHGRVMTLDGVVQITEADEFVYQEMIAHVPLLQHGSAKRVLIIGAGDGGVLRRVLQHGTVQHVAMVEIDEAVIRLAKQFFPDVSGPAWEDSRARVCIGDGIAFIAEADSQSFDVIIVDSTDPAGPGETLFSGPFYRECARVLGPAGLLVNQGGVPFLQARELRESTALRRQAFAQATAYVVAVPSYVGGFMAIGLAGSGGLEPHAEAEVARRATLAGIAGKTQYWTPAVHRAAFALPPYIAQHLA